VVCTSTGSPVFGVTELKALCSPGLSLFSNNTVGRYCEVAMMSCVSGSLLMHSLGPGLWYRGAVLSRGYVVCDTVP
jgi:hypothetical protein